MHDCQPASDMLIEIALQPEASATNEILNCAACREQIAGLRAAADATAAAVQLLQPDERYWAGYHARLRARLADDARVTSHSESREGLRSALRAFLTSRIRVPAPIAVAICALIVVSLFLALKRRTAQNVVPSAPSTIVKTVEVPVVRERFLTRVVYRDRQTVWRRSSAVARSSVRTDEPDNSARIAQSLAGFKPAPEAKLTVIKGSSRDEK